MLQIKCKCIHMHFKIGLLNKFHFHYKTAILWQTMLLLYTEHKLHCKFKYDQSADRARTRERSRAHCINSVVLAELFSLAV